MSNETPEHMMFHLKFPGLGIMHIPMYLTLEFSNFLQVSLYRMLGILVILVVIIKVS